MNSHDHGKDLVKDFSRLMILLGGSDDSWTGDFCRLVLKSDRPHRAALEKAFPVEAIVVQAWQQSPYSPVAAWEVLIRLMRENAIHGMPTLKMDADGDWVVSVTFPPPPGVDVPTLGGLEMDDRLREALQDPGMRELATVALSRILLDPEPTLVDKAVCGTPDCQHPLPCDRTGETISASVGVLGEPEGFYGRWCDWVCFGTFVDHVALQGKARGNAPH
jgi:hypothetical protein